MARWAEVEVMGHRAHVGTISEDTFAGAMWLRVEALQADGTFEVYRYSAGAIFGFRELTEQEARRALVPRAWRACEAFEASAVLPCACKRCGRDAEEHVEAKRLPEASSEGLEADIPSVLDGDAEPVSADGAP